MRVLVFHGYLLRGTGSNIYNAELARWLVDRGHEVQLFCQERDAAELDFVDAVGRWEDGQLRTQVLRTPVRCTAYLPDIGGLLPVYVADPYEGFDARPFPQLTDAELERYIDANVAAIRDVIAVAEPDEALANHLIMGPVILARALPARIPYAVAIHGSALEYTVRPNLERFGRYAREGLAQARGVLVGSRHTAESLWETVRQPGLPAKTRLLGPGVDVRRFRPCPPERARARLRDLAAKAEADQQVLGPAGGSPEDLRTADPARERIVSYVGKLIVSKGVDLLIAAWPLVAQQAQDARLVIAGYGEYRDALARLTRALGDGDLAAARDIATRGRELEGGPRGELRYLAAFLDGLTGAGRERYLAVSRDAMRRVHFTGRLEHDQVSDLMGLSRVVVVPSTFPEAFGMVLAEAACCGSIPVSSSHSGLAEVTATLAPALPAGLRDQLSFSLGPGAVSELAAKISGWLPAQAAQPRVPAPARPELTELASTHFGWPEVADGVIAAAQGRLSQLEPVPDLAPCWTWRSPPPWPADQAR